MRKVFLILGLSLTSAPLVAQAAPPGPRASDVQSMDAILAALYDVISGPIGQARDWDRMRNLFVPGARLIPTVYRPDSVPTLRNLSVEDYITRAGPMLEKNGFFETEIARQVERPTLQRRPALVGGDGVLGGRAARQPDPPEIPEERRQLTRQMPPSQG